MSARGKGAATAWLLSAMLCCGCSNNSPKPNIQPIGNGQKASNDTRPSSDSSDRINSPVIAPPSATTDKTSSGVGGEPDSATAKNGDVLAELKALQSKQVRGNDRDTVLAHFTKMLGLSEKALDTTLEPKDRDEVREATAQVIFILSQIDPSRQDLVEKADKLAASTLADTPEGPLAVTVLFFRAATHLYVARAAAAADPETNTRLVNIAKEFAVKAPKDERAPQLLFMIAQKAMSEGQNETATDTLKHVAEIDPDGQFGLMAAGKLNLITTMGKPPEIAGPTLDGNEIDISQYKGKVVLVDFWATWCGPCVGELPNVRKVYDKYHEQGFEVIAVSLDQKKNSLERFVEENKLPWPQIFFDEDGKRFWDNPISRKYGIDGIPATFLVDREGNLQRTDIRGEELEVAVKKLVGEN